MGLFISAIASGLAAQDHGREAAWKIEIILNNVGDKSFKNQFDLTKKSGFDDYIRVYCDGLPENYKTAIKDLSDICIGYINPKNPSLLSYEDRVNVLNNFKALYTAKLAPSKGKSTKKDIENFNTFDEGINKLIKNWTPKPKAKTNRKVVLESDDEEEGEEESFEDKMRRLGVPIRRVLPTE